MAIAGTKQPVFKKAGHEAAPKKPYGNVSYADPGYLPDKKARYPIDAKHVQAAWSYINQTQNSSKYTDAQLGAIKRRIMGAMKRHGHDIYAQAAHASMSKMKKQTAHAASGANAKLNTTFGG